MLRKETLESSLRGEVIMPGESGYEQARKVYNGMIDRRPAAIVRCADVADVAAVVKTAAAEKLGLAVRGGGHSGAGLGTCDEGLVLDLSRMCGVRVNRARKTVRVGAGCTWGDVDHATHPFGLAVPSGIVSSTGVGGLTLGGGHGYLTRKFALTIDNLLEADMVLADGSLVTASPEQNEDLFWAIRGGGGNFGVATSFLFRAHPVDTVYGGPMLWPAERGRELMQAYGELMAAAPDDVYGFFAFMKVPPAPPFPPELYGRDMVGVVWSILGDDRQAENALAPMRGMGPAFEHVGRVPFPAMQSAFDPLYPAGLQWYWKAAFLRDIDDEIIDVHLAHASSVPTAHSTVHLYPIDGAASRVPEEATAFSYRDARFSEVIVGVDPDPGKAGMIREWARSLWSDLSPHSAGAAYVNFMMEEESDRVRATYRGNFERLRQVKRRYDPDNLFCVNWNISPA